MNNSETRLSIGGVSPEWTRRLACPGDPLIAPRKHFRVLPTRTRPSLFGGD